MDNREELLTALQLTYNLSLFFFAGGERPPLTQSHALGLPNLGVKKHQTPEGSLGPKGYPNDTSGPNVAISSLTCPTLAKVWNSRTFGAISPVESGIFDPRKFGLA